MSLRDAKDTAIFHAARAAGSVVMTKDKDFVELLRRLGPPPKVLWVTCGNTSNARLRGLLPIERGSIIVRCDLLTEDTVPHISVPEDTFRRLAARAAALDISVDDLVRPILDRLAEAGLVPPEPPSPLTGDAWRAELEAWKHDAESRAGRYPPDFRLDDSRETVYRERENSQI